MRKSIAATALIGTAAVLSACSHGQAEDAGATVSRNYQVGGFEQIEVAGPYDVEVRTGSGPTVAANGSEKLLERTVVEVKGGTLSIHPKEQKGWFHSGWHRGKAKFVVTVPALRGATIAGSGGIKVDRVAGDSFEGTIAGSGGLQLASTDVKSLKLSIGGSGGIQAGTGKAKVVEYDIAGSGGIQAQGVNAEQAKISIAGSGSVTGNATSTAEVDIMGSGNVNISGGAKCTVSKAGSGNVKCS
ncbi:MAG TPA: head GIN domain-containing protein [Sphingomicrobium sp.]|nr:head GIN domain-containing protein [Sphingomicrobium sp.]